MKRETAVVIREFNPSFLMTRSEDGEFLVPTSGPAERLFDYGINCFIREADATRLIQHPNVVHQQTHFKENGTAYSVSEYHAGATLAAVLKGQEGKLQERAAFAIIVPLLDGLTAGHRKGLIHGRLSPQQIFLTKAGRPMLLRFHVTQILLARRCGRVKDISTPGFTPPELMLPDGKKGPWSDVYASGATLYSIITGKRPPEAMLRREHDSFPDILHKEDEISKGLKKVLNRAMALDWNDRPQTIQELKQEILEQMPATSRPYETAVELKPDQIEEVIKPVIEQESKKDKLKLKKAKTASDIALLSQEGPDKEDLKKAPVAKAPQKPEPPKRPLRSITLEDIDSEEASEWLPKLKPEKDSGDGIPFKKEPAIETNPLGPLSSEIAFLAPKSGDRTLTAHEIKQELSTTPLQQVVSSATANRTRMMGVAAIAACILLFVFVGLWNRFKPGVGGELPPTEIATVETASAAAAPASYSTAYMLLLAKADSLKEAAQNFAITGDTLNRIRLYEETADVYRQILLTQPDDSVAITQLERVEAQKALLTAAPITISAPTIEPLDPEESAALPKEAIAFLARGDSLLTRRAFVQARAEYEGALKLIPDQAHALAMLEQIDTEIEKIALQRQIRVLLRRGDNYVRTEAFEEAKRTFNEALALNPGDGVILGRLRDVNNRLEQQQSIAEQFDQLKEQGDTFFEQKRYSSALISYESAQTLRPDDLYVEEQIKAVKEGMQELESVLLQRESQFAQYKSQADSLFKAGQYEEALPLYRITEALDPQNTEIKEKLAYIADAQTAEAFVGVDEEGIFLIPEIPPEMTNNANVISRIVYPAEARRNGIEGLVIVKMLVDENGEASRMEILKGIGHGCDKEALRVLRRAKFKPATYEGQPVKAWHTHPIKFKIIK